MGSNRSRSFRARGSPANRKNDADGDPLSYPKHDTTSELNGFRNSVVSFSA